MRSHALAAALVALLLPSVSSGADDAECRRMRQEYEVLKADGKQLKKLTDPKAAKQRLKKKHKGDRTALRRALKKLHKTPGGLGPEAQSAIREYNARVQDLKTRAKEAHATFEGTLPQEKFQTAECFRRLAAANPLFELPGLLRDLAKIDQADAAFSALDQPVADPSSWNERKVAFHKEAWDRLHPSRFVFLAKDLSKATKPYPTERPWFKNEPLMIIGIGSSASSRSPLVKVVGVDGAKREVPQTMLRLKPAGKLGTHRLRPEHLQLRQDRNHIGGPIDFKLETKGHRLKALRFRGAIDESQPASRRFFKARDKIIACYERKMEQLDPDNRRNYFDLVTYGKGTPKVQSLAAAYDRKACRKCGCKKFYKHKRKFAHQVITPLQKLRFAKEVEPRIERAERAITDWYAQNS